jgi:hypothetical protein
MSVLMEDAAETLASSYVQPGDLVRIGDRRGQWMQRAGFAMSWGGLWPFVEAFEIAQGMEQVAPVPDQRPIQ